MLTVAVLGLREYLFFTHKFSHFSFCFLSPHASVNAAIILQFWLNCTWLMFRNAFDWSSVACTEHWPHLEPMLLSFTYKQRCVLKVITAYGNLVMVVISIFFYFHFLFSILSVPVFVIYFSFHLSGSITFTQDTSGFVFHSKSVHWPVTLVGCY